MERSYSFLKCPDIYSLFHLVTPLNLKEIEKSLFSEIILLTYIIEYKWGGNCLGYISLSFVDL